MKARRLKFAAAILLTLAAASVVELAASYRWTHAVVTSWHFTCATCKGSLIVALEPNSPRRWLWLAVPTTQTSVASGFIGFKWQRDRWGLLVGLPLWLLAAVFAWSARWLLKRARAPLPGHCAICGYDLRATPERCPECGTAAFVIEA